MSKNRLLVFVVGKMNDKYESSHSITLRVVYEYDSHQTPEPLSTGILVGIVDIYPLVLAHFLTSIN